MLNETKRSGYFVRSAVAILSIALASMVGYRFFFLAPHGQIDAGLITIICLVVVLVLAEAFDNFSIGQLITISRESEKKEQEIDKLEKNNQNLLSQLLKLSVSQTQNQSHTNVYGDYHAAAVVSRADEIEIEAKKDAEVDAPKTSKASNQEDTQVFSLTTTPSSESRSSSAQIRSRFNITKDKEIATRKYFGDDRPPHGLTMNVKLSEQSEAFDPVSTTPIIFDAYIKELGEETFIEFKTQPVSILFRDRLYLMLSKIYHYRVAKRVDAHLKLIIIRIPGEVPRFGSLERNLNSFEPARNSGLLRISYVELSKEEAESCRESASSE